VVTLIEKSRRSLRKVVDADAEGTVRETVAEAVAVGHVTVGHETVVSLARGPRSLVKPHF